MLRRPQLQSEQDAQRRYLSIPKLSVLLSSRQMDSLLFSSCLPMLYCSRCGLPHSKVANGGYLTLVQAATSAFQIVGGPALAPDGKGLSTPLSSHKLPTASGLHPFPSSSLLNFPSLRAGATGLPASRACAANPPTPGLTSLAMLQQYNLLTSQGHGAVREQSQHFQPAMLSNQAAPFMPRSSLQNATAAAAAPSPTALPAGQVAGLSISRETYLT